MGSFELVSGSLGYNPSSGINRSKASLRLAHGFSIETLQARSEWQEIFQVMKSKGLQPRLLYPARLSIKMVGEIRGFSDKRRLEKYTSTKPALEDILKGLL